MGWSSRTSYTYSRAEDANHTPVENFAVPRGRWGRSDSNFPHNLISSIIYQPDHRYENRMVDSVLRGWEFTGVLQFQSGAPYTVRTGTDNLVNGYYGSRPVQTKGAKLSSSRPRSEERARWVRHDGICEPRPREDGKHRRRHVPVSGLQKRKHLGLEELQHLRQAPL